MAYKTEDGGPYPNLAGEFCGNHDPTTIPQSYETEQDRKDEQARLNRMRFGKPSHCKAGTSEELAARGVVGLYLKEDRELLYFETPVDTNELTEAVVTQP